jgi:hypothetical protein
LKSPHDLKAYMNPVAERVATRPRKPPALRSSPRRRA